MFVLHNNPLRELGPGQDSGDKSASSLIKSSLTPLTQLTPIINILHGSCLAASVCLSRLNWLNDCLTSLLEYLNMIYPVNLKVYSEDNWNLLVFWNFLFLFKKYEASPKSILWSHVPTSFLCDMHMLQDVRCVLPVWLIGRDIQKAHLKSINASCSVNFFALLGWKTFLP